jgi:hypothetical protein
MVLASTFFIAVGDGVGTLVGDASTVGTGEKVGKLELVDVAVGAAGFSPQEARITNVTNMLILRMAGIVFERTNMVASVQALTDSAFFVRILCRELAVLDAADRPAMPLVTYFYHSTLTRANIPNPMMIAPEIRLTHCSRPGLKLARNMPTVPLNRNHHEAEPVNTPSTRIPADP